MQKGKLEKKRIYPVDEWNIIEEKFDVETNYLDETIFSIGNGYIGMRGNFEEGYQGPKETSVEGTYINGFYESHPIKYGEPAYGYAQTGQTMLNVTNSKIIKLYIDDEEFSMFSGEIESYKRVLNMKEGTLTRDVIWKSPKGKKVHIKIQRFISFTNKHLFAIRYEVVPINFSGKLTIVSALDGNVENMKTSKDPRVGSALDHQPLELVKKEQSGSYGSLAHITPNTNFTLLCSMEHDLETSSDFDVENESYGQTVRTKYVIDSKEGENIVLNKYITYYTSRDYPVEELETKAKEALILAKNKGYKQLLESHKEFLDEFWSQASIEIKGDEALQQGIRYNEFQLLQSVGKDGKTSIAAKGLTGQGYEGHYFWDTEIYVLPFFLYNYPEIAKKLLEYRYMILDKARQRAREMAHDKGALYPWRTIEGEECSAYYPAGTAQYHINADIIYAVKKYMEVTDDMDFLLKFGAEMIFETARLWIGLGNYIPKKNNKFCIDCVTGPDEYTAIVNNNFYTNFMAKMHLEYAYEVANLLKDRYKDDYNRLKDKINLEEVELTEWKKAADNMYLPYDEELDIYPQDDTFLEKPVWDFENTPKDNYPLLLHYHPLVIYRHQVCKQPDVLLAMYLLGDKFTKEQKEKNYNYYEPITTHDSSLSPCVFSILAAEIGYYDKAYEYFMHTARIDLDNYHNNSQHGVHTACMGGTWMSVVNGFARMRVYDGELRFNPYVPDGWEGYKFKIKFKKNQLEINVKPDKVTYRLLDGKNIEFYHGDRKIKLNKGEEMKVDIIGN